MAIGTVSYGAVSANSGNSVSLTPGYPSSPGAGDLLLVWAYCRANQADCFALSGWTTLVQTATANGSYAIFWKASDGTESGTVTVTSAAPALGSQLARMALIPGAQASGTIYSGTPTAETEAAATPVSNAGVSPSVGGCQIFLFTGKGDGGNNTTNDYSAWAGNSLTWAGVANGTTSGNDAAIGIGSANKSGTGATGALTATNTLTFVGVSYAIAIQPSTATTHQLTGTLAGTASLSGALLATVPVSGTCAATATLSGAPIQETSLTGTLSATAGFAGDPSVPQTHAVDGTLAAAATFAGATVQTIGLDGVLAGISGYVGTPLSDVLASGTMTGSGTFSGDFAGLIPFSGMVSASAALSGEPEHDVLLDGLLAAAAGLSGELTGGSSTHLLDGLLAGTATLEGVVLVENLISGTLMAVATFAGDPVAYVISASKLPHVVLSNGVPSARASGGPLMVALPSLPSACRPR